jgi:phosphinothricin acetyltransferase
MAEAKLAGETNTTGALVRPADARDLPEITELYNHYVVHTPITFDLEPVTLENRSEWFSHFAPAGPHRLLVAEEDGRVLGYACTHSFRPKQAYETSVESTVYLHHEATGRGLGTLLYRALFDAIAGEDLRIAVAGVTLPNDASLALHQRFGFTPIGVMHEIGRKFGRYWDVAWFEKRLDLS